MLSELDIPVTEHEFKLFRDLVREKTGISLTDTKRALLNSRLITRLRFYDYQSFEQYYEHLRSRDPHGHELQEMTNAITTNMTSFFREKHHFALLARDVLVPARQLALEGRAPSLRLWSAGCSSGEEAYSLAMTVADNLLHVPSWDVKILATDIDTQVVKVARAGMYPREAVRDLAPDVVKKHFLRGIGTCEDCVRIKPSLAGMISFARLNLMEDGWPFQRKFDAIFCRNVIIYFDHDNQRRLLEHFVRYLNPGGLFFAGHSENLFWLDSLLEPIGSTVYRLRPTKRTT